MDVIKTRKGEPTGNGERGTESLDECTAVFRIKIQNGGRRKRTGSLGNGDGNENATKQ